MDWNVINICIATTCNKYLKFAASFLESLYEHLNSKYKYHLYFLSNEIVNEDIKNKLFYKKIENFEVTFIHIDEKKIFWKYENLKNRLNIILYRWLLSDYINEDRILFMDHDTITRWDISELYFTDLWDNIIWAAKDCVLWDVPILKEYGIKKYFNAWIQLINLKKRKEEDLKNRALKFVDSNFKNLWIPDQDTLNILLKDERLPISPKWNWIWRDKIWYRESQYTNEEYKELNNPIVVHYAGDTHRPWKWWICLHPYRYLYFKYIFKTRYREYSDFFMFIFRIFSSNIIMRYIGRMIITILWKIRKLYLKVNKE